MSIAKKNSDFFCLTSAALVRGRSPARPPPRRIGAAATPSCACACSGWRPPCAPRQRSGDLGCPWETRTAHPAAPRVRTGFCTCFGECFCVCLCKHSRACSSVCFLPYGWFATAWTYVTGAACAQHSKGFLSVLTVSLSCASAAPNEITGRKQRVSARSGPSGWWHTGACVPGGSVQCAPKGSSATPEG